MQFNHSVSLGILLSLLSPAAHAVLNGTPISESAHPSVKLIRLGQTGVCTGTFITPTAMLTAGHCVTEAHNQGLAITVEGQSPKSQKVHPKFTSSAADHMAYDVAVLRFRNPVSADLSQLSATAPTAGQAVVLVGYGMSEYDNPSTVGVKREGRNVISDVMFGQIAVNHSSQDYSTNVILNGDSGGPLLTENGAVLGVAHMGAKTPSGDGTTEAYTSYIDVTDPGIAPFIRDAIR